MLLDPAIQTIIEDNVKAYFVLILLFVCAVRWFSSVFNFLEYI